MKPSYSHHEPCLLAIQQYIQKINNETKNSFSNTLKSLKNDLYNHCRANKKKNHNYEVCTFMRLIFLPVLEKYDGRYNNAQHQRNNNKIRNYDSFPFTINKKIDEKVNYNDIDHKIPDNISTNNEINQNTHNEIHMKNKSLLSNKSTIEKDQEQDSSSSHFSPKDSFTKPLSSGYDSYEPSSEGTNNNKNPNSKQNQLMKTLQQQKIKKAKDAAAAANSWTPSDCTYTKTPKSSLPGRPYQRVDESKWILQKKITSNTYEAIHGETGFGAKASKKFRRVQGKKFQHEKTKVKRSYNSFARTGQCIDKGSYSIKF